MNSDTPRIAGFEPISACLPGVLERLREARLHFDARSSRGAADDVNLNNVDTFALMQSHEHAKNAVNPSLRAFSLRKRNNRKFFRREGCHSSEHQVRGSICSCRCRRSRKNQGFTRGNSSFWLSTAFDICTTGRSVQTPAVINNSGEFRDDTSRSSGTFAARRLQWRADRVAQIRPIDIGTNFFAPDHTTTFSLKRDC